MTRMRETRAPALSVLERVQLLERESSLETLAACLTDVRARRGRLVVVSGEAGIGKTALVREFCDRLGGGARVLWGACDGLHTPRPLGPLADIAASTGGVLADALGRGERPAGCFAGLAAELGAASPTVLVLEDVQWADEATLDVLLMLGHRAEGMGALMIVTYRDDELAANHPLRSALGELRAGSGVRRLALQALSLDAVSRLAKPYGVDGADLHRRTAGNPFFVTEVLAAAGGSIPSTVRDAVLARAGLLSAHGRSVLEAVAVIPQRAEVWLLEALLSHRIEHLDECLRSGMLRPQGQAVAFRHELARLAVEDAIGPHRCVSLHRAVLTALRDPPDGNRDPARLAHHAEAAGDTEAVLEFAPLAAVRAAALGAHREAAAQYARALRFGDRLGLDERGELLERRSDECAMTALHADAIADLRAALECYRMLGDRRKQANVLCSLARRLSCPGENTEANAMAEQAVRVLDGIPPCRELARAHAVMASILMHDEEAAEAFAWGARAVELAERLGERDILVYALNDLGTMGFLTEKPGGREPLERSLRLALEAGYEEHAARAYVNFAGAAVRVRAFALAADCIREGIEYCTARDLELYRHYLFAHRARIELDHGLWDDAVQSAALVTEDERSSMDARCPALTVLGLVRARRGDPDAWSPLAQAQELAESGYLQRLAPVAAARAEALWLEGREAQIDAATRPAFELAVQRNSPWLIGELAYWRRQAGLRDELPAEMIAEPYRLSITGRWREAAERWTQIGCPYEAALALADSDEPRTVRRSITALQELGARAAAAIVARRLRARGIRGVPRGPRPRTRENPAGLTARELEVLTLLAEGWRNAQIAQRLVVSEKTVDHHVSAVLRKLDVRTRGEAGAIALRLGLTEEHQKPPLARA